MAWRHSTFYLHYLARPSVFVSRTPGVGLATAFDRCGDRKRICLFGGWFRPRRSTPQDVRAQFYLQPERASAIIVVNTGLIGAAIGAMVLAAFRKSERVRRDVAELVAETLSPLFRSSGRLLTIGKVGETPRSDAAQSLGGYTRANVAAGRSSISASDRPFSSSAVINAYIVAIRWEDTESCLIFEEQGRVDAGYTQRGRVYVPDGKPYMNLVTIERGHPCHHGVAA